jgi:hypothetical protein
VIGIDHHCVPEGKAGNVVKRVHKVAASAATLAAVIWLAGSTGAQATAKPKPEIAPGITFQGAGPDAASIQSVVDQFRAAIGGTNNGNNPGPLAEGRREINWDGGGSTATAPGPTPFEVFLNSRGGLMTTPGTGFVQAPAAGLADTFGNPSLATTFGFFSPVRLFAPVGSTLTDVSFFVPGTAGGTPAATAAFGAVFSDVDSPDGGGRGVRQSQRRASSHILYYDADGKLLYKSAIAASPGTATLSFFGILFSDPRITCVRILTGHSSPAWGIDPKVDLVVMDDFIYAEPQARQ